MIYRESNRIVLYSFLLCGIVIVLVTWTIGAKFISNPLIALGIDLVLAAGIAQLFEKYLESKMNRSIDALVTKLSRVREGDLTQRFKEEQDDALPYGLSSELGRMMDFFRGTMGDLWKTTATLIRQLGQLITATQESLGEFRGEVALLSDIGRNLDDVRGEIGTLARTVGELQLSATADAAAIETANRSGATVEGDVRDRQKLMAAVTGSLNDLQYLCDGMFGLLDEVGAIGRRVAGVGKRISELLNQSNLIKLNASIDASQEHVPAENYNKLIAEIGRMFENVSAIAQESTDVSSFTESRLSELHMRLENSKTGLRSGISTSERVGGLLGTIAGHFQESGAAYSAAGGHAQGLKTAIGLADHTAAEFSKTVRNSVSRFDKLRSDTQITLLKFGELETKIEAIQESLKKLEAFKNLFKIA